MFSQDVVGLALGWSDGFSIKLWIVLDWWMLSGGLLFRLFYHSIFFFFFFFFFCQYLSLLRIGLQVDREGIPDDWCYIHCVSLTDIFMIVIHLFYHSIATCYKSVWRVLNVHLKTYTVIMREMIALSMRCSERALASGDKIHQTTYLSILMAAAQDRAGWRQVVCMWPILSP